MNCSANWVIEVECITCPYSKEELCDYPYIHDTNCSILSTSELAVLSNSSHQLS